MIVTGQDIAECIEFMKKVYSESAELIKTVEESFKVKKWYHPTNSTTVYKDSSASLNNPGAWMPKYLFRYFTKKKKSYDEVLGITITYDWDFHELNFEEPMICCSKIKFNENIKDCNAAWFVLGGFRKYCEKITYFSSNLYSDSVIRSECVWNDPYIEKGVASGFYLPLVSVKNSKDVDNYIVDPLLKLSEGSLDETQKLIKEKAINLIV